MNDLQFIELLKRVFFEFFFIRKNGKRPSLMNMSELIEVYKKEVIKEFLNQQKNSQNEQDNNDKQAI